MDLLVRSWNVFHGNAVPPERRGYLEAAVCLAASDAPDVICFQELPAWADTRLGAWTGMRSYMDVAAPPRLGPFPSTAEVGRVVSKLHQGLLRSALTGQANAVLVRPGISASDPALLVLNDRRFRRAQARWLGLGPLARFVWAKERRVCQAFRLGVDDVGTLVLANLHATSYPPDERIADAELLRAAVFVDALARPDEPCVLAGDFNVFADRSRTLADLTGEEWGFTLFGSRVDHFLVRGADLLGGEVWPEERRRFGGHLLSDHAPVDVRIRLGRAR